MWVPGRKKEAAEGRQVVADAEMLLSGEMVDLNARVPPRRVRPWMVVNALAHADRATLEQLGQPRGVTASRPRGSNSTVAFLAAEVLSSASDGIELVRLQREVLVPLELRLLGREIPSPPTIGQLASLVFAALDGRPSCGC